MSYDALWKVNLKHVTDPEWGLGPCSNVRQGLLRRKTAGAHSTPSSEVRGTLTHFSLLLGLTQSIVDIDSVSDQHL